MAEDKYISRTKRILDVLDSLASTASIAEPLNTTPNPSDMLNTQKWLHDISFGRSPAGRGPPRTSLRTPSRLNSITSNVRAKPYWKRPTEMAAAAATKIKDVSFEADAEPVDSEVPSSIVDALFAKRHEPSTVDALLTKRHQPVVKSITGRNIAGSVKSNTFNANIVDLEADVSSESNKAALESVVPIQVQLDSEKGFLTKNREFSFAKPIIRGPQAPMEVESEDSSDESSDDDDVEIEKDAEQISAKATNSDTSSSDNSPENNKRQQTPISVISEIKTPTSLISEIKTPIPVVNGAITSTGGNDWECSMCMVQNKATVDKCVCCETPKEGGGGSNNAPPQPTFKPTEFKAAANPAFKFGITVAAPPPPSQPTLQSTDPATGSFMPPATKSDTPFAFNLNGGSLFGSSSSANNTSKVDVINTNGFGLNNSVNGVTAPSSDSPFSFGAVPTQQASVPALQPSFPSNGSFMPPATKSDTPFTFNTTLPSLNGGFLFGGSSSANTNGFGLNNGATAPSNDSLFSFGAVPTQQASVPALQPSFPSTGSFMPSAGGGSSMSSSSRKLLLAKRKKRP